MSCRMKDYSLVITSYEVWKAIHTQHPELRVFGSYSAPNGNEFGNLNKGMMFTSYGFPQSDYPIMEGQTTWDIDREHPEIRMNEVHEYWLCIPMPETE